MGQVIGKGRIHADAIPFINLEPDRVEKLWSHYKLHSDGFALDPDALKHVLKIIYEDDDDLESKCRALFAKLDTDSFLHIFHRKREKPRKNVLQMQQKHMAIDSSNFQQNLVPTDLSRPGCQLNAKPCQLNAPVTFWCFWRLKIHWCV